MTEEATRILVIEDEPDLARTMEYNLRLARFEVATAGTGREALQLARSFVPDLVTLDLMLPDIPGIDVYRALRAMTELQSTPVVVVSARADEVDRVVLFELGVDDYVTKPFSVRELVLRIQARLRRGDVPQDPQRAGRIAFGVLEIDASAHRVFVAGQPVALTVIEFRLLSALFNQRNRAQTRELLLRSVASMRLSAGSRTIDTHVKRLREKLGPAGGYIHTVRGVGYRFAAAPDDLADLTVGE